MQGERGRERNKVEVRRGDSQGGRRESVGLRCYQQRTKTSDIAAAMHDQHRGVVIEMTQRGKLCSDLTVGEVV